MSPGGAHSEIVGRYGEGWKVRVAARAERGRANEALLDLLAETLGVPRARVDLVAGASSRDKVVVVEGISQEQADRTLAARQRKGDG